VVPDYTRAYQLELERDMNKEALLKYTMLNELEGKREMLHSKFFTQKVDAVAYHTAELVRIKMEYEIALEEAQKTSCGQCFVFCIMDKGNDIVKRKIRDSGVISIFY
jgi:hypothetical protein